MNAEKHMKMAGAVRTGGKGSITRKKKAVHTDDKRPLKKQGIKEVKDETTVLNPEVIASDDDGDIAKDWGTWGFHNHELCIESNRQQRFYSKFWEDLMLNSNDDEDEGYEIQLDDEIAKDLLALTSGSRTAIELTPPPSPTHHY